MIAIVGLALELPQATTADQWWHLVETAHPEPGRLTRADDFAPSAFGLSRDQAALLDPQERRLIQSCAHALEDAGHATAVDRGCVGVFVTCGASDYQRHLVDLGLIADQAVPHTEDRVASSVAKYLGLDGPSVEVRAGDAGGLVALHLAAQSLLQEECDTALAAAVRVSSHLTASAGNLSPSQPDKGGEGVVVMVLRRLEDAVAAEDPILAVLSGSVIRNDAALRTEPHVVSAKGAHRGLAEALALSGVAPHEVGLVVVQQSEHAPADEAHLAAVEHAIGHDARPRRSVGAAQKRGSFLHGLGAVAEVVMSLDRRAMLPETGVSQTSSSDAWLTERVACISGYSSNGATAHLVVAQAPTLSAPAETYPHAQVLMVGGHSERSAQLTSLALAEHLAQAGHSLDAPRLANVAFTLREGRPAGRYRVATVAAEPISAATALQQASVVTAQRTCPTTLTVPHSTAVQVQTLHELLTLPFVVEAAHTCLEALATAGLDFELPQTHTDTATANAHPLALSFTVLLCSGWLLKSVGCPVDHVDHDAVGPTVQAVLDATISLEEAAQRLAHLPRTALPPQEHPRHDVLAKGAHVVAAVGTGVEAHPPVPGSILLFDPPALWDDATEPGLRAWFGVLHAVAALWTHGVDVDLDRIGEVTGSSPEADNGAQVRRVHLPCTVFDEILCTPTASTSSPQAPAPMATSPAATPGPRRANRLNDRVHHSSSVSGRDSTSGSAESAGVELIEMTPGQRDCVRGDSGREDRDSWVVHEIDYVAGDIDHLEASWRRILPLHPLLNATVNDQNAFVIGPEPHFSVDRHDLRSMDTDDASRAYQALRQDFLESGPSLSTSPRVKVAAATLPTGAIRVLVGVDPLVCDPPSWHALDRDLFAAHRGHAPAPVGDPTAKVSNAMAEAQAEDAVDGDKKADYWRRRATTLGLAPQIWAEQPTSGPTHRTRITQTLTPSEWDGLRQNASSLQIGPTALLLCSFQDTLAQWADSNEMVVLLRSFERSVAVDPSVVANFGHDTPHQRSSTDGSFLKRAHATQELLEIDEQHATSRAVNLIRETLAIEGEQFLWPVAFTVPTPAPLNDPAIGYTPHWMGHVVSTTATHPGLVLNHQAELREGRLVLHWDIDARVIDPTTAEDFLTLHTERLRRLARDLEAWQATPDVLAQGATGIAPLDSHAQVPEILEPGAAFLEQLPDAQPLPVAQSLPDQETVSDAQPLPVAEPSPELEPSPDAQSLRVAEPSPNLQTLPAVAAAIVPTAVIAADSVPCAPAELSLESAEPQPPPRASTSNDDLPSHDRSKAPSAGAPLEATLDDTDNKVKAADPTTQTTVDPLALEDDERERPLRQGVGPDETSVSPSGSSTATEVTAIDQAAAATSSDSPEPLDGPTETASHNAGSSMPPPATQRERALAPDAAAAAASVSVAALSHAHHRTQHHAQASLPPAEDSSLAPVVASFPAPTTDSAQLPIATSPSDTGAESPSSTVEHELEAPAAPPAVEPPTPAAPPSDERPTAPTRPPSHQPVPPSPQAPQAPTGDTLTSRLARPLNAKVADRPLLHLFHPAGGDLGHYAALAHRLSELVHCVGYSDLYARLHDGQARLLPADVPTMARAFVDAVRAEQPEGPYLLAGWGTGGSLAHVVADHLAQAGSKVAFVGLVDSSMPRSHKIAPSDTQALQTSLMSWYLGAVEAARGIDLGMGDSQQFYTQLLAMAPHDRMLRVEGMLRESGVLAAEESLVPRLAVWARDLQAFTSFHAQPWAAHDARVLIIRAQRPSPRNGGLGIGPTDADPCAAWPTVLNNAPLHAVDVNEHHYALMRGAGLDFVADTLSRALGEVLPAVPPPNVNVASTEGQPPHNKNRPVIDLREESETAAQRDPLPPPM